MLLFYHLSILRIKKVFLFIYEISFIFPTCYRGVGKGGAGGPEPSRNLPDQLPKVFEPGLADFTPHTTASPLGFKKLSTPLT